MKRFLASLLVAFVPASTALADESAPPAPVAAVAPAPRTRVVGVMLSSSQALVWDEERSEYALRRVGDSIDGARIVGLDSDHVVVERDGARSEIEIGAAPLKAPARRTARRMPAVIIGSLAHEPAPVAAAPAPVVAAPPVPVVVAPAAIAPPAPVVAAPAIPVVVAPAAIAPPAPVVVAPPAPAAAAPAPVAAPTPVVVAPPRAPAPPAAPAAPAAAGEDDEVEAMIIPRADLDRELGDFATLSREAQVVPTANGGFMLMRVRPGSFVSRVGLRAGDVILRIDNRPINRVEDAASAYAWLRVTDRFFVDVLRDGQPMRLHYVIAPGGTRATR